jgi:alpha-galactosidase
VKVFILAGQSNMEGKAKNERLESQAAAPETRDLFEHPRKGGKWIVRDDGFIKFLGRKGRLTIGYGSPGRTGAELEFGTVMGDHFDEPVLLIKTAWGGPLAVQALPPALGRPAQRWAPPEGARAGPRAGQAAQREPPAQLHIPSDLVTPAAVRGDCRGDWNAREGLATSRPDLNGLVSGPPLCVA